MQKTVDLTGRFASVTGQVLNASKSYWWATNYDSHPGDSDIVLAGEVVPRSTGGRHLGAHLAFQRRVKNELAAKRVSRGVAVAERIRWAPLPMSVRAQLLSALVSSSALYGYCVGGMTCKQLESLTSAVMRALWGSKRKLRSKELVLSLFVHGHLVDPKQASVYQCVRALRHFMRKCPDTMELVRMCWQRVVEGQYAPGPVGLVMRSVRRIGWDWVSFEEFSRPGRRPLLVLGGADSWWDHELRDGLRLCQWRICARKRHDMEGLDAVQGIDRCATMALHNKSSPFDAGILRGVLSGSLRMQKRLFDAGLASSSMCPLCGMTDETVEHCFWECPHWSHIRSKFDIPTLSVVRTWLVCTRQCGLFLEDVHVLDLSAVLEDEECVLRDFAAHYNLRACREFIESSDSQSPQTVWTDGACSNNQDDRFRRAGSGVFYSSAHSMNWQGMLPGLLQSNQRAELFAVLVTCLRDPRPLDIRSDSMYVCDGFANWQTWMHEGWPGQHADLWNALASELSGRAHMVSVSWVLGHAKRIDVMRGRTSWEDKLGNDGADALAVAGAASHAAPVEVIASAKSRRLLALSVQAMMLAIARARQAAFPLACDHDADRGSDLGDSDDSDTKEKLICIDEVVCVDSESILHDVELEPGDGDSNDGDHQWVVDHGGDFVVAFDLDARTCPKHIKDDFELEPVGCDGNDCYQCVAHHEGDPGVASASAFIPASVAFDLDHEFDDGSNHLSAVG